MRSTSLRVSLLLPLLLCTVVQAQNLQVRQADTGAASIRAHVGDTLSIELTAQLGNLRAAGVAINISLPDAGLAVVDAAARPFAPALFVDGMEFANKQLAADRTFGLSADAALLTYSVVLGPGDVRYRSGTGVVATFDVVCTAPVSGTIQLVDSAAHQSMLVLDDGRTERAFRQVASLQVDVGKPAGKRSAGTWADIKARTQP